MLIWIEGEKGISSIYFHLLFNTSCQDIFTKLHLITKDCVEEDEEEEKEE